MQKGIKVVKKGEENTKSDGFKAALAKTLENQRQKREQERDFRNRNRKNFLKVPAAVFSNDPRDVIAK